MGAEAVIMCGDVTERRAGRAQVLRLDIGPDADPQHRIGLELDAIVRPFADNLSDVVADMLELAAYVWAADRLISRGSPMLSDMGAGWRRNLQFKIAVRKSELWNSAHVRSALVEALEFISEDNFDFEFSKTQKRTGIEPYFGFSDPHAQVIDPDAVILFSGGLDSTAGIAEQLLGQGSRVSVVTHRNATWLVPRQTELLAQFRDRARKRSVFDVPISITKGTPEPVEFSQRTRAFLFAVLGLLVARMFDKAKIVFYENGVTSFNLPIADHVLGTRASRTTHPRTLRALERLFSLVLERATEIENPFLWKTKHEVVEVLKRLGCADLIRNTTSCAQVRQLPMTSKQCGVCVQCVERRFAVLASDLESEDPAEGYALDLFRSAHEKVEGVTMLECHALRAQKLAGMSETAFSAAYGQVFRALSSMPGPAFENLRRIYDLHRRYGQYVVRVIDDELRKSANLDAALSLPATCLLTMINAPFAGAPAYMDPVEQEAPASAQAQRDRQTVARRQFIFAVDSKTKRIVFSDGPELKGVAYELFMFLAEQYRRDHDNRTPKNSYGFVSSKELRRILGVDEARLRQRVLAARTRLSRQFTECIDYLIDDQDIIQSRRWTGYRLNPYLLLVDVADLRGSTKTAETQRNDS